MKRIILATLLVILLAVPSCMICYGSGISPDINLITNPGFESAGTGWPSNPTYWNVDSSTAHSGMASLKFRNTDTKVFPYIAIPVAVQTDARYQINAWVKTENVAGTSTGASVAIEFFDANNVKLTGCAYPAGISGTTDWTKISVLTEKVPQNAVRARFILMLRQGSYGTAWFDDISINVVYSDIYFKSMLIHPNYRNIIMNRSENFVTVGAKVVGNALHPESEMQINATITDPSGNMISGSAFPSGNLNIPSVINLNNLNVADGDYIVDVKLMDVNTGEVIMKESHTVSFVNNGELLPATYIDNSNRTIVDGKPFFPLGFYCSGSTSDNIKNIKRLATSKFNTLMNYRTPTYTLNEIKSYLDTASTYNIKVIFSVKDCYEGSTSAISSYGSWVGAPNVLKGMVDTFKDHPSILAWYINDELTGSFLPAIADANNYITNNDPNHPTWQALFKSQNIKAHVDTSDLMGIDDYPVMEQTKYNLSSPNISSLQQSTGIINNAVMNSRGVWMVPECSRIRINETTLSNRPPTYKEIMCEAYQALVSGARGLIFYNLTYLLNYDGTAQWNVMVNVGNNLSAISPIALGDDLPADKQTLTSDSRISMITRSVNGETYIIAVNPYYDNVTASFKIWDSTAADYIASGVPGSTLQSLNLSDGIFTDTIEALGTRIYKLSKTAPATETTTGSTTTGGTTKGKGKR